MQAAFMRLPASSAAECTICLRVLPSRRDGLSLTASARYVAAKVGRSSALSIFVYESAPAKLCGFSGNGGADYCSA